MRSTNRFLLLMAILISGSVAKSQSKNFIDQPFIEVNGAFDTLITPNQIFIRITISERDSKNKVAVEEQETQMINALKALGINTEKDLVVTDLISNYRFYLLKQKDILKTKAYTVKVTNAAMAGKVFVQLEDLNISNVNVEKVDHSDLPQFKELCRAKAVENAVKKANNMTKPLGQSIGPAINITDTEMPNNSLTGNTGGIMLRGIRTMSSEDKYEAPDVEFEKIRIRQALNVKFVLNPK